MAIEITPPKHWEDWLSLVLGVWLGAASPWLLQFAGDMIVAQNAFLVGLLLVLTEIVTLTAFRVWEEWINVVLGAWLIISPWVLGIAALVPTANFVIVGFLVLALALYEMWDVRRHSGHPA
ncbi:MAG: SPW repeat protein [Stellaceae bacterium]